MEKPDWIVKRITKAADFGYYKLRVEGTNLSSIHNGAPEEFYWTVRDVADPRFDLSGAEIDPDALPYLGR